MTTALLRLKASDTGQPLTFPVTVLDRRVVYGRDECQVSPVGGSGSAWVSVTRLTYPVETP